MRYLVTLVAVTLLAVPAAGDVIIGEAQSLHTQPSVRSAGLGDCSVAVLDNAAACSWNPGGLAFMVGDVNLDGVFNGLLPEWEDVYYRHGAIGVRVNDALVVASSLLYVTYEEQWLPGTDNPAVMESYDPYELTPSLAAAVSVGEHLGLGVNLKYTKVYLPPADYSQGRQPSDGSAFAADLGGELRFSPVKGDFAMVGRAAAVVQNVGADIEYEDRDESDPLPRAIKAGTSWQMSLGSAAHVLLCAEYDYPLDDGDDAANEVFRWGSEFQCSVIQLGASLVNSPPSEISDLLAVRIGHINETRGIHGNSLGIGVGMEVKDAFQLTTDFAWVPQVSGLKRHWRFGASTWFVF